MRKIGALTPQIVVPMDDDQEEELEKQHDELETLRVPTTMPTTQTAGGIEATSEPTTSFVDMQLQQAINTMVGMVVLNETKPGQLPDVATQPTTSAITAGAPVVQPTTGPDGGARPVGPMPLNPSTSPTTMP